MKVRIDKSVFADATNEANLMELSFLLHIIIYKHRYELKVSDAEVLDSDSFSKLTQTEQKIIKEEITQTIMASSTNADCEVMSDGDAEDTKKVFSPSEAIIYLLQPLSVILENGLNDSHFIKALFQLFDNTGELMRRTNEGWIRFENAGGCSNVRNFITSRIKTYGDKQKFLNCYVLLDGDRRYPSDPEPGKKYNRLLSDLNNWKVGNHVLEKRSMENYMTDEAMESFRNVENQGWISAYLTMNAGQKDLFSIAEGFTKDINKEQKATVRHKESLLTTKDLNRRKMSYVRGFLPIAEQNFYGSISKGNFLHLEKGLKMKDFKVKFPEKFGDGVVTYKTNMLRRTSHQNDPQELQHIVDGIFALI